MILDWDIDPVLLRIGQFELRYYGLLFVTGLALGYTVVKRMYQREGLSLEKLDTLAFYVFLATIVGARLGHCLFYEPEYYLKHPLQMILPFRITDGEFNFTGYQGLASHGGILGVFIAIILYSRKHKGPLMEILDKVAVGGALTGVFIRLANFFNSEILGKPTGGDYGVIFRRVDDVVRHPGQLYESLSYLIIFIILFTLYHRTDLKRKHGFLFGLFFVLLFLARFVVEYFKINQVSFEEGMSYNMGQLLSIPFILGGLFAMWWSWRRYGGGES